MGRFKNILFRTMFKKEMNEYCSSLQARYDEYIRAKDKEVEEKKELYNLMERAFDEKMIIVGIEKNKNNQEVIVTKDENDFYLYGHSYKVINNHPRLLTSRLNFKFNDEIKIEDILVVDNNLGNGSILMQYFIEHCRRIGIKRITGYLSSVDKDHFDRSEHFYKKHGFTVNFNEDHTAGNIELLL